MYSAPSTDTSVFAGDNTLRKMIAAPLISNRSTFLRSAIGLLYLNLIAKITSNGSFIVLAHLLKPKTRGIVIPNSRSVFLRCDLQDF